MNILPFVGLVDGNRRFTCIRRLHREFPSDERYAYFLAAIIKVDGKQITRHLFPSTTVPSSSTTPGSICPNFSISLFVERFLSSLVDHIKFSTSSLYFFESVSFKVARLVCSKCK